MKVQLWKLDSAHIKKEKMACEAVVSTGEGLWCNNAQADSGSIPCTVSQQPPGQSSLHSLLPEPCPSLPNKHTQGKIPNTATPNSTPQSLHPAFPTPQAAPSPLFYPPHLPLCCHLQDLLDFGNDLLRTAPLLLHGVAVAEALGVQPGQLPLGQGQPHAPLLPAKGHRTPSLKLDTALGHSGCPTQYRGALGCLVF